VVSVTLDSGTYNIVFSLKQIRELESHRDIVVL